MRCRHCPHGPRACNHPKVQPFEGEPPSRLGSAIVDWWIDHPQHAQGRTPGEPSRPCPGAQQEGVGSPRRGV